MMCSRCHKRPAVVFMSGMSGTQKFENGYCLKCAKELGIPQVDNYLKQMGISDIDFDNEDGMPFINGGGFGEDDDIDMDELELELIDYDIDEVFLDEGEINIFADFKNYGPISKYLEDHGFEIKSFKFERIPLSLRELSPEEQEEVYQQGLERRTKKKTA